MITVRGVGKGLGAAVALLAVLTAGWLFVRFGSANAARLASPDMRIHVDFETFWRSAVALRQHTDLYRTGAQLANLDPPALSVVLSPLSLLDVLSAYHLFAVVNALLIVGSVIAVAEHTGLDTRWAMIATAALLASSPLHGTLALGQMYGLLTVALTVAWLAQRRGHPVSAGVAIGVAAAVKPSLLPLLAWPLLYRRWQTLASALAAGAATTVLGLIAGGWAATGEWLSLLRAVGTTGFLDNDSLAGLAVRFNQPAWLGYLVAAGLLALTMRRAGRRPELAIWSITAASLLLAPIAWNNYLVLLAPSVPLLLARGQRAAALPLLALPLIGIEWSQLLTTDTLLTRLGMSLYCAMLVTYWAVLTFVPIGGVARPVRPAPATVAECRSQSAAQHDRPPEHSPPY